jgi:hypothetical protein
LLVIHTLLKGLDKYLPEIFKNSSEVNSIGTIAMLPKILSHALNAIEKLRAEINSLQDFQDNHADTQ